MTEPQTDDYYTKLYEPIEHYGGNILEIGCGDGHFSNFILNKNIDIISLDINRSSLINAKQCYPNLSVIQGDAEQLPFPDSFFDIIVSIECFEHLSNIDSHLLEVHRVLANEGVYLIKTPNKLWDTPYWMIFHGASYKDLKSPGSHISTQTSFELKNILAKHGFEPNFMSFNLMVQRRKRKLLSRFVFTIFERTYGHLPFFLQPPLFCIAKKSPQKNSRQT